MATAASRFGFKSSTSPHHAASAADILKLKKPSKDFLCPNYISNPVQFVEFQIRDMKSNHVFFDVGRPIETLDWTQSNMVDPENMTRTIEYAFPKEILSFESIGTNLVFAIHYFKDKMIKSFDFSFGFCIPNSVNTWENVYKVPKLDEKTIKDMVANPNKTVSDSYYFVNDKLIMHNKAYYTYY
ncbi:hypothetical protein BCR33DRAFT_724289 [Rhizoclosmatium globosum]|uniref:GMP phosphodiesterase delta subunit domain-containing protein n=1 Tax=Rhizoclosmatium globosum TaxID=329046 RepID=A0A1Y2B6J1_9FUNG|nr:hypothetical protein BCR33DRAFT_724289 [Rhizoclosmatium globosum]|eukprot:ORY30459.1 hypothetical protein BCR33DRAFT_724289 [Rhizoclosmatium globosum]